MARHNVVASQVVGQLAILAVTPVLARSFGPAELGTYQIALALAIILQPLATLRSEMFIPVAGSRNSVLMLTQRAFIGTAVVTGALIGVSSAAQISGILDSLDIGLMAAIMLLPYAWGAVDTAVLLRSQAMNRVAARNLLFGVIASLLQVLISVVHPSALLLAVSVLVGRGISVAATRERTKPRDDTHLTETRDTVVGYNRVAPTVASGMLATASAQSLTIVASVALGPSAVGITSMAQRISTVPAMLLSQGISQVIQASAAGAVRNRDVSVAHAVRKQARDAYLIAFAAGIGVAVMGPPIADALFGEDWESVADLLPILAVALVPHLIAGSMSPVLVLLGRERLLARISAIRFLITIGPAFACALATSEVYWTTIGFAVGSALGSCVNISIVHSSIRRYDRTESDVLSNYSEC